MRRLVLVDPRRLDADALAHAERCDRCKDLIASARALDDRLHGAFQVPVPDGLAERALQNATQAPGISRRHALAAGIALAVGASAGAAMFWRRNDPLALAGIDFVVYEEAQAILDAKPADPRELAVAAARVGIRLPEQLGELRYVGTCPFGGGIAHHVVLKTAYGKVTLLLLPDRTLDRRAIAAAHGLEAVVAPCVGGSVAIIADSSRSLVRVESSLTHA